MTLLNEGGDDGSVEGTKVGVVVVGDSDGPFDGSDVVGNMLGREDGSIVGRLDAWSEGRNDGVQFDGSVDGMGVSDTGFSHRGCASSGA